MTEDFTEPLKSKSTRGFASLTKERQRELASRGGKAAHAKGKAHVFTKTEATAAGRLGGKTHSAEHMRAIGAKGGATRRRQLKGDA